eukprot:TRINITY_DN2578_c0_g2_i3.p1 TRINITY_DN2578_c0_g2~~TRINITY_DN2578_c0_g2_i3.p1  ORF type:complete len:498 (+),score=86.53 TRINITY_DN2578_c0_g2_i3:21-1514(+)
MPFGRYDPNEKVDLFENVYYSHDYYDSRKRNPEYQRKPKQSLIHTIPAKKRPQLKAEIEAPYAEHFFYKIGEHGWEDSSFRRDEWFHNVDSDVKKYYDPELGIQRQTFYQNRTPPREAEPDSYHHYDEEPDDTVVKPDFVGLNPALGDYQPGSSLDWRMQQDLLLGMYDKMANPSDLTSLGIPYDDYVKLSIESKRDFASFNTVAEHIGFLYLLGLVGSWFLRPLTTIRARAWPWWKRVSAMSQNLSLPLEVSMGFTQFASVKKKPSSTSIAKISPIRPSQSDFRVPRWYASELLEKIRKVPELFHRKWDLFGRNSWAMRATPKSIETTRVDPVAHKKVIDVDPINLSRNGRPAPYSHFPITWQVIQERAQFAERWHFPLSAFAQNTFFGSRKVANRLILLYVQFVVANYLVQKSTLFEDKSKMQRAIVASTLVLTWHSTYRGGIRWLGKSLVCMTPAYLMLLQLDASTRKSMKGFPRPKVPFQEVQEFKEFQESRK